MKKTSSILWGIVLLALGVIFALNAFEITSIGLFDGWWTLFIIIPCGIGIITQKDKTGNLIGLLIGVFLLLSAQGLLSFQLIWKLILPAILVIIGVKFLIQGVTGNRAGAVIERMKTSGKDPKVGCAAFSGCDLNFNGEIFDGAELTAAFGAVECDLRGALIQNDCAIQATSVFGGIDILVPENLSVKVTSTSLFGGVSNHSADKNSSPTLYVNCVCLFGGIEIK